MGIEVLEVEKRALNQRKSDDFAEARIAQIARELQLLQSNRQVEVLNRRESEDIFLAGGESLRAEMARLRNLNIDMSRIKLATIDRAAMEPLSEIKPKKMLIIVSGIIAGLVLGIAFMLFSNFLRSKNLA